MNPTTFFYIFLVILVLILFYFLLAKKWINPYKLIMIFGKKGSGKTTLLCKLSIRYNKKGWTVYCTVPMPGTFLISPDQIGRVYLKPRSVLLVDECSLIWSNRSFKSFSHDVEEFFRLQRHDKIRVYLFSQTFDIDKKIRDLTDQMYLMTNVLTFFSYGKKINKKTVLTIAQADRPSMIAENLQFESILLFWCGSRFFTFIPKYARFFNSFDVIPRPEVFLTYEDFSPFYLGSRVGYSRFLVSCFKRSRCKSA